MTLALLPYPRFRATDDDGNPLAGGFLWSYLATTSTPQALLTSDGSTAASNPIELDDQGEADVRLGPLAYKLRLTDSLGVELWIVDNVSSLAPTTLGDYSATAAQMRLATDPGEAGSESLATSLAGELERLRFAQYETKRALDPSITYWYETPYGAAVYNVKAYGATGDGSTDDTAALIAALAAVPSTGGVLYFPAGTYIVTSALSLEDRYNIALVGASSARRHLNSQAATLQYTAASGSLLTFNGAIGVLIKGLNLSYNHASYADNLIVVSQGTGALDASEITIEDCSLMGNTGGSLNATALLKLGDEMYNLVIQRCVLAGAQVGIQGSTTLKINANAVTIRNNLFLSPFSYSQIVLGGSQWNLVENTFEPRTGTLGNAVFMDPIGIDGLRIVGNLFTDGNSASTKWVQLSNGVASGVLIAGNTFQDINAGSHAIDFGTAAATGVTITGNELYCGVGIVAPNVLDLFSVGNSFSYGGGIGIQAYPAGKGLHQDDDEVRFIGSDVTQSAPLVSARATSTGSVNGNSLEWGHWTTGFGNQLGYLNGSGHGFIALGAEHGSGTSDYRTRGEIGRVLQRTTSGGLIIGRIATASADGQSLTADVTISAAGAVQLNTGGFRQVLVTPTYGASVAINLSLGSLFKIVVTDASAFTVANPTGTGDGTLYTIMIVNTSGGAHGTITWGTQYKRAASASLTVASACNQSICFADAGGAADVQYELCRTGGDVPN